MLKIISFLFYTSLSIFSSHRMRKKFQEKYGDLVHLGYCKSKYFPIDQIMENALSIILLCQLVYIYWSEQNIFLSIGLAIGAILNLLFSIKTIYSDWRKVYVYKYGVSIGGHDYHIEKMEEYFENEEGISIAVIKRKRIEFEILEDISNNELRLFDYKNFGNNKKG